MHPKPLRTAGEQKQSWSRRGWRWTVGRLSLRGTRTNVGMQRIASSPGMPSQHRLPRTWHRRLFRWPPRPASTMRIPGRVPPPPRGPGADWLRVRCTTATRGRLAVASHVSDVVTGRAALQSTWGPGAGADGGPFPPVAVARGAFPTRAFGPNAPGFPLQTGDTPGSSAHVTRASSLSR